MVEFIARGYVPRKKTEKQQPANCCVGWPNKGWSKEKKFARVPALFYILYLVHQKKEKKGEELLDAKGRDMRFLNLAMSKMSSIISVMGMNVNPSTAISQMIHILSYHIPFW